MKVKVEFVVETDDFGKKEFKKEIETLLEDIDFDTKLLTFDMYEIGKIECYNCGNIIDEEDYKCSYCGKRGV